MQELQVVYAGRGRGRPTERFVCLDGFFKVLVMGWDLGKVSLVCYSAECVGYFCPSSFLQRGPQ